MTTAPDNLPTVTHEGELAIGSLTIRIMVLSNGQRVIPKEDFEALLNWLEGDVELSDDDLGAMSQVFCRGVP